MTREMNKWEGFSLKELLALYVVPYTNGLTRALNSDLNREIARQTEINELEDR